MHSNALNHLMTAQRPAAVIIIMIWYTGGWWVYCDVRYCTVYTVVVVTLP